ncbi:DUF397 domain-containing protein [Streptomyces rectiverticillatus]|uniref:DUF397 domain-containing protein n=1 Tax=Streptomyces rectiverticillatus TaxID=173860 RepID=UPI0015C38D88|nr:DUF397 domain-containing protein [Streptomyces rectiverticillatus]QLE74447.1 DUF397 domain-containing protein [Streptomyces rectiverticillatus]
MSTASDLSTAEWRKSSYSNGDNGSCVEVAVTIPGGIPVRDSKTPGGPVLLFPPTAWMAFIRAVSPPCCTAPRP